MLLRYARAITQQFALPSLASILEFNTKVSCDRIEISTIQPDLFILFYLDPRGNHPASRQLSDRGQPPLFYLQLESRILNPRR